MENQNYSLLIDKLDKFIRKFYVNRIIKGLLIGLGLILALFLFSSGLEYFGRFGSTVRAIVFFGFLILSIVVAAHYIIVPALKLFRIGKVLSYEAAANIIGKHFNEVDDKIVNTLQLRQLADNQGDSFTTSLLNASIDKRIESLRPLPFLQSIDLSENRRYLKYAVLPIIALAALLFINSSIITEGTDRLVNYNKDFVEEAPFSFKWLSRESDVIQGEDLDIDLSVVGNAVPIEAYINFSGRTHKMKNLGPGEFVYRIRNIQESAELSFMASGFKSEAFRINVMPRPVLSRFDLELDYPAYIRKKDEILENVGDIIVPLGTRLKWILKTENTDSVNFIFGTGKESAEMSRQGIFTFRKTIRDEGQYSIITRNEFDAANDSITYQLSLIPDLYPEIRMSAIADSANDKLIYFNGSIADDYGFKALKFQYKKTSADGDEARGSKSIGINYGMTEQAFFYYFNFEELELKPGETVDYFFEVFDNDGVNGSKSSRTQQLKYALPSLEEMKEDQGERSESIKKELKESLKEIKNIQRELDELKKKMLDQKELDWEDKKKLQSLLSRQAEVQESVQKANKLNKENLEERQNYNPSSERILEKQKRLEEMFEKLIDEEMKKTLEELEKLMEKSDKEDLEELNMDNKEVEKELDRMLEFYKELELEQKLEEKLTELFLLLLS